MVDTRPKALEKARKRAAKLKAQRDALQENNPVQAERPPGGNFESERQKAKSALRSEIDAYDGTGVHKISADADKQQEERILNVAAYCRVSTDDIEQTISIEMQKKNYREKIRANPKWRYCGLYVDATDIIGLKQNPTNGRRFSPIFSFIGHLSKKFEKMLLLKQRRKTEYGKDKALVDLSKSMNAFRHFREQEALWQTQSKKSHWRNFTLFRITHSV